MAPGMDRHRDGEVVVLVGGLWLPGWILYPLARRLRRGGFDTRIFDYPTVAQDLRANAAALAAFARALPQPTVHFVGYSLGGLVVRALFQYDPPLRPGHIVTLASPHQGSAAAARLRQTHAGRRLLGHGAGALAPGALASWPLPPRPFGIIAGTFPVGLGRFVTRFAEPSDGTVALSEALLPGTEPLVLPVSHAGILYSAGAARAVCQFLAHGRFS